MAYEVPQQQAYSLSVANPLDLQTEGFRLGQAQAQEQRTKTQFQQQQAAQQALKDAFQTTDISSPEGQQDLIRKVGKIDPMKAIELQGNFQQQATRQAQLKEQQEKLTEQQNKDREAVFAESYPFVQNLMQQFASDSKLNSGLNVKDTWEQTHNKMKQFGDDLLSRYPNNPQVKQLVDKIESATPELVGQFLQAGQPHYQALTAKQRLEESQMKAAEERNRISQEREDRLSQAETDRLKDKGLISPEAEAQRVRIAREEAGIREGEAEKLADKKNELKVNQTLQGGRESVYNQRIINSGNEAVAALHNISRLNIDSSTGVAGAGRHRTGVLDAGKEALAQKLTPEDSQLYNTMVAGLTRAMASIEMSGLAGGQRLSEQIGPSVTLNPGDTQLTKLAKLAEARQIIDRGMDTLLTNPRLSPDQRKLAQKIRDDAAQSIPWTQDDIIDLKNAQDNGSGITLREEMRYKQLKAKQGATQ